MQKTHGGYDVLLECMAYLAQHHLRRYDNYRKKYGSENTLGLLLHDAFLLMSTRVHSPEDQAVLKVHKEPLTAEKARQYVEAAGGRVDKAAELAGVSRATMYRALHRE